MSDPHPDPAIGLFAPPGGWRVRIIDLSGGAEDGVVEEIGGFGSLMHANAYAARYVRSSIETCRAGGDARSVLKTWQAFGEDAEVLDEQSRPAEGGWRSMEAVADFADHPAGGEAVDWRAIDPRAIGDEGEDDEAAEGGAPDGA